MNVLTIGGATYDVIIHYNAERSCSSFFQEQHVFLAQKAQNTGKNLNMLVVVEQTNSAVSFHRLGNNVTSCFSGEMIVPETLLYNYYKK